MRFHDFWYVVAESRELGRSDVLARRVLDEWLVVFRDAGGGPAVFRDRCRHRASRLSLGCVRAGQLQCPYHGWTYAGDGTVVAVPAEGADHAPVDGRRATVYEAKEADGYVYVRLAAGADTTPYPMPHWGEPGWGHVRLQNRFQNNVTNCVENFVDVPHTVFVHPGIFRTRRAQAIDAHVSRAEGTVTVTYQNETDNLGWFAWFLNPGRTPIVHVDRFLMPNITNVEYRFGPRRVFFITSQSVPVSDEETLVYTDLTYDYGMWNALAGPVVRYQAQAVIDQDIRALNQQMSVIRRYPEPFANTAVDVVHVFIESIRDELARGADPRALAPRQIDVRFFV